ncbi:MAG TPA: flagellar hook-basal body protein [Desulfitobacteriaceae bacterium]|nr:flagellar hook-basal body protein [Desulfitobacteriaceae bacterium]
MRLITTGASGIRAQQLAMDITADNLANVATPGFKAGRLDFAETLAAAVRTENAALPNGALVREGFSVGSGVLVNGVGQDFRQGAICTTDNVWDMSIQGPGLFQVSLSDGETAYTRAGSFKPNAHGQLVDEQGNLLAVRIPLETANITVDSSGKITGTIMGEQRTFGSVGSTGFDGQTPYVPTGPYTMDSSGRLRDGKGLLVPAMIVVPQQASAVSISKDGAISGFIEGKPQVFGQVTLAEFTDQEGLNRIGDNLAVLSASSGKAEIGLPGQGMGEICSSSLEQSNVDMAVAMTDLIQIQRAYQMNSRMIQDGDQMWEQANSLRR